MTWITLVAIGYFLSLVGQRLRQQIATATAGIWLLTPWLVAILCHKPAPEQEKTQWTGDRDLAPRANALASNYQAGKEPLRMQSIAKLLVKHYNDAETSLEAAHSPE